MLYISYLAVRALVKVTVLAIVGIALMIRWAAVAIASAADYYAKDRAQSKAKGISIEVPKPVAPASHKVYGFDPQPVTQPVPAAPRTQVAYHFESRPVAKPVPLADREAVVASMRKAQSFTAVRRTVVRSR